MRVSDLFPLGFWSRVQEKRKGRRGKVVLKPPSTAMDRAGVQPGTQETCNGEGKRRLW
jgi:hypothetical protein